MWPFAPPPPTPASHYSHNFIADQQNTLSKRNSVGRKPPLPRVAFTIKQTKVTIAGSGTVVWVSNPLVGDLAGTEHGGDDPM